MYVHNLFGLCVFMLCVKNDEREYSDDEIHENAISKIENHLRRILAI